MSAARGVGFLSTILFILICSSLGGCSAESGDTTEPSVPTESTDPSDASDASDPSGNVSSADPSDASDSTDASDATESSDPTDASDTSDASDPSTIQDDPSESAGYDPCREKICGDTCTLCDPEDEDCRESGPNRACDESGQCVQANGLVCGDPAYIPCEGKTCGESCTICAPDDDDCAETDVLKFCDRIGACVADTGDVCEELYDPCSGKSCGDTCTICPPDDDDCAETSELKACNPDGDCVSDTGDLCVEEYDPCEGKSCGETCTVCEPGDLDCFETGEIKACTVDGRCVSDTGDLCTETSVCGRINAGDDVIATLEWSGGCGDLTLYATKPDRTIELNLYIAGVCEEAHSASDTLTRNYELPSDSVSLGITAGQYVDEFTCNDAILNEPVIDETLVPQSGTLELTVVPDGESEPWAFPSVVEAKLTDVVFVDGTGCSFTLNYTWTDVYAGWFPGR